MNLKKRKSLIPSYPPEASIVRQRTKGDQVTVEGHLDMNTITLKIIAGDEDWERFKEYCLTENPSNLQSVIFEQFIQPAIAKIRGRKISEKDDLIGNMKLSSKWLYSFFKYWNRKPLNEWPEYLCMLTEVIKEDETYTQEKSGKYSPGDLTEYCIKNFFSQGIKEHELRPFEDPFNFYQTYIKDATDPPIQTELYNSFFRGKTPTEIQKYAFRYPLKDILFSLL
jgi:hypothetical protein